MNREDAVRLAYRHAAVALNSYRDHSLDDELAAEPALSATDRTLLDEQLDDLQHYLEAVASPGGPERFDHLPADHPAPVTSPDQWFADGLGEAMGSTGPDLNGAPDTGYCAPAIGVHVTPHRGCVMR